jgi:hypothetical protein
MSRSHPGEGAATGRSSGRTFSVQEAFEAAISELDARPSFPDELVRVEIVRIGAEVGGIDGRRVAVVDVKRVTP